MRMIDRIRIMLGFQTEAAVFRISDTVFPVWHWVAMNEISAVQLYCRLSGKSFKDNSAFFAFYCAYRLEHTLISVKYHIMIIAGTHPERRIIIVKARPECMLVTKINWSLHICLYRNANDCRPSLHERAARYSSDLHIRQRPLSCRLPFYLPQTA